jgi:mRNA interferase RelE/StbE
MGRALYGLAFGPRATAYLDNLVARKLRARLVRKARSLIDDPHPPGCKKLKAVMEGADPVWRIRSGDYRILYVVREFEVVITDIGHRKDVYR